jgi:hypothetical protein
MTTQNVKLHKGDRIAIKGINYQMASTTNVRVQKGREDTKEAEASANHRTDAAQAVDKNTVLAIIQKKIRALEQKENNALFDIGADDVLFEFDETDCTPQASISEHISITDQITNLQELLKEIKAL